MIWYTLGEEATELRIPFLDRVVLLTLAASAQDGASQLCARETLRRYDSPHREFVCAALPL